jgi:SCY1-like protein 1
MWSFFTKDPSKDLNYELLESVSNGVLDDKTIWSVHNGKKKGTTSDLVTIFAFQARQGNESWVCALLLKYNKHRLVAR